MKKTIVAPSILSADFAYMGQAIKELQESKADWIHVDVMDGVFVPNISFGQKMVKDIRPLTTLPLDVHLMIVNPERYIKEFADRGADYITIHIESTQNVKEALTLIKQCGKKAGISVKPNTPVSEIEPYLDDLDLILIMSVEPGFGGQKFMPIALDKIREAKKLIGNRNILVEVDGGVGESNIEEIRQTCVDAVVAGSSVFNAPDKAVAIRRLSYSE